MSLPDEKSLRRFQDSDLAALRRLIYETIEVSYAPVYPPRAVAFFKAFHAEEKILARSQAGTLLVLEEPGGLTATGCLVGDEIFGVFVRPDLQGGGRGELLMQALEAAALAAGVVEAELSVSLPSLAFYKGLGYGIVEARSRDLGEGERLAFWTARKRLLPASEV